LREREAPSRKGGEKKGNGKNLQSGKGRVSNVQEDTKKKDKLEEEGGRGGITSF